jgi:transcription elongation factor GreA
MRLLFFDYSRTARFAARRRKTTVRKNTMDKVPMTAPGLSKLETELKRLKSSERPAIIKAIEEARAHGDLSENAEYHAAKERQSFVEGRIMELEDVIARADVVDPSKLSGDIVRFGATVIVADEDNDEKTKYTIVGSHEADIGSGLLSVTSPLARALIGKTIGDTVEVKAPKGDTFYEIVEVKFV